MLKGVPSKNHLDFLKKLNVSYLGTAVSRNMVFAAQACVPMLEGAAGRALATIQAEFGRKALTRGYTKLYNMCRTCMKVAGPAKGQSAMELMTFVLEGILFELRYELTTVELSLIHI